MKRRIIPCLVIIFSIHHTKHINTNYYELTSVSAMNGLSSRPKLLYWLLHMIFQSNCINKYPHLKQVEGRGEHSYLPITAQVLTSTSWSNPPLLVTAHWMYFTAPGMTLTMASLVPSMQHMHCGERLDLKHRIICQYHYSGLRSYHNLRLNKFSLLISARVRPWISLRA